MMRAFAGAAAIVAAAALAAPAAAEGWRVKPAGADGPLTLDYGEGAATYYRLQCLPAELVVTQFGVTKLLDLQTNKPVADTPGATMTAGAAVMALATDKVQPNLVPAAAVANPAGGWDMTIRIRKDDAAFLSLPRAGMVSLFTTGYTRAVMVGKDDRKLLGDFVRQCRG
jgi:hypothetical protein